MEERFPELGRAQITRFHERGWWRDETWLDDLRRAVSFGPDRAAIVFERALARDQRVMSYADLQRRVDHFAAALLELGVRRGEIVAVQLPNWWQFNALLLACARIGAIAAPLAVDYRGHELAFILQRTEAPLYIGPAEWMGFSHRDMMRDIAKTTPSLRKRVLIGLNAASERGEQEEPSDPGELDFDDHFVCAHQRSPHEKNSECHSNNELERSAPNPDDVFLIMYTSGTTGEPKGVVHSYNTLWAATRALVETMELGRDDVIGSPSPMTGLAGFFYNFLVPLYVGGAAVYCDIADPDRLLGLAEKYGVTLMYAVPSHLLGIIQAQERLHKKTRALKGIVTGSAPIAPTLIRSVQESFGVRLHALWGMTECGGVTFTRLHDPPDWPANSDGSTVPWMEFKIDVDSVAADERATLPEGTGRLLVRGANQCLGYFKRDDLYRACLDSEGWFDTGDLARSDGRGGIRIVGRLKDVIFRHGIKIPVASVEALLAAHPGVHEVALVPEADPRFGERVVAVIVPRAAPAPTTPGELGEYLRGRGRAAQYWPDRLRIIDEMPKTPNGKIRRHALQGS